MSSVEVSRDDPRHGLWSLRAAAQVVNIGDILIDVKVFWSMLGRSPKLTQLCSQELTLWLRRGWMLGRKAKQAARASSG